MHIPSKMRANGRPVAIAPACSEVRPPLSNRTIPIPPTATSQIVFCLSSVSVRPPAVIVSITSVPESQPVTKKIRIRPIAIKDVNCAQGSAPSSTNNCVSSDALVRSAPLPATIWAILASPKIVSHNMPSKLGKITAPAINSRTVRPSEIRAMNIPTNGAQLIHHAQ